MTGWVEHPRCCATCRVFICSIPDSRTTLKAASTISSREIFDRGGILSAFYYACYITPVIILRLRKYVGSQMILFVNVATGIAQGDEKFRSAYLPLGTTYESWLLVVNTNILTAAFSPTTTHPSTTSPSFPDFHVPPSRTFTTPLSSASRSFPPCVLSHYCSRCLGEWNEARP